MGTPMVENLLKGSVDVTVYIEVLIKLYHL